MRVVIVPDQMRAMAADMAELANVLDAHSRRLKLLQNDVVDIVRADSMAHETLPHLCRSLEQTASRLRDEALDLRRRVRVAEADTMWLTRPVSLAVTTPTMRSSRKGALILLGSSGIGTRRVQSMLNLVLGAGLDVDGMFGLKTDAAVRLFQRRHGLDVDGIVGTKTLAALRRAAAEARANLSVALAGTVTALTAELMHFAELAGTLTKWFKRLIENLRSTLLSIMSSMSASERQLIADLRSAGMTDKQFAELLKGGHVVIDDPTLYDKWRELDGVHKRSSSHYKSVHSQQYGISGSFVKEALFGKGPHGTTWIQLERHPWGGHDGWGTDDVGHAWDYLDYKWGPNDNVGPYGQSEHNDKHPIRIG